MNCTEKLCRFCLRHVRDTYFDDLGEPCDILNALNLKLNMNIIEEPVICVDCVESLRKLFSFKAICLQTVDSFMPFINSHVNKKIDLQQVYLEINGRTSLDDKQVCRFCMSETPINFFLELNAIEFMLPTKYFLDYFPEMDMNLVSDPIICTTCHNLLQDHVTFTRKCLNVEENIQKYVEEGGTNAEVKINLKDVKQFMAKVIVKKEIEDGDTFKYEIQYDKIMEHAFSKVDIKMESYMQTEDSQLEIKSESIEVKPIVTNPESILDVAPAESRENYNNHFVIQDFPHSKSYKCPDNGSSIREWHILANKKSENKMSKHMNENYVFKTSHKGINCPSEVTIHKCGVEGCLFETKFKNNLITHKLIHKDPLEITMYKCEIEDCSFETKYKSSFIKHKLTHKNVSEGTTYKCGFEGCLYEAKRKRYLTNHRLLHKDPSEVTMYKCDIEDCSFETKHKGNLVKHKLIHKDISEIITYKCEFEGCLYETKYKSCIVDHMLIHKDPSEITMYKCGNCSYESKHKNRLIDHKLIHKDPSEITMYRCEIDYCLFETKYKRSFTKHRLIHKDISEIISYKCGFEGCLYETKCKSYLINHKLLHKDPSEITMYKCGIEGCSYKTKRQRDLIRHKLIHKDVSEIRMYKCGFERCLYEAKRKSHLIRHSLKHKDASEVTMYKCGFENCSFESKRKSSLIRHILIHKDPSKVSAFKCKSEKGSKHKVWSAIK